jgi:hypothetical protein
MPLSADDILQAFAGLSEELARRGENAEIVVVGGAALVLLFHARESTKDVDAYFVNQKPRSYATPLKQLQAVLSCRRIG